MVRTLALVAVLAAASACASFGGGAEPASVPPSACADKAASAIASGVTTGASACFEIPGVSLSDGDFKDFAGLSPVFDHIDKACGYYPARKNYVYVASSAAGVRGFVTVTVNAQGKATDAAKFLIRKAGESGPVTCP